MTSGKSLAFGHRRTAPSVCCVVSVGRSVMSTVQTIFPRPLGHRHAVAGRGGVPSAPQRRSGARGLAALLLAAVVASLVVIADRLISTWADGHLLLAWVVLWAVVFAGMALFA